MPARSAAWRATRHVAADRQVARRQTAASPTPFGLFAGAGRVARLLLAREALPCNGSGTALSVDLSFGGWRRIIGQLAEVVRPSLALSVVFAFLSIHSSMATDAAQSAEGRTANVGQSGRRLIPRGQSICRACCSWIRQNSVVAGFARIQTGVEKALNSGEFSITLSHDHDF